MNEIHVVPTEESHEESLDCWCAPEVDDEEPLVIVHNSHDEREKFETGQRKPS